jgi:uncharacterized membrane protein YbhN (UPF0104 family)
MDRQTVTQTVPPTRSRPWKEVLLAAALSVAGIGLLVALRGLDWQSFPSQLRRLDWRWIVVAVCFDILSYLAQGLRWSLLLHGRSLWRTTRAIYAGLFVNEVVPLRPGEAIRAWIAARDFHLRTWAVVPTMLVERLMDGLWLAIALLITLPAAPLPRALVQAVGILAALVGAAVLAAHLSGRTRIEFLRNVNAGMRDFRALAVSALFLAAQGLAFWAVARASHLSIGLLAAFVVMVIVRIGTMIPGAPANLGTHQFSTVLGLSLYGIPLAQAAAFSLVVFTVLTLPLLIIGLGACISAGLSWQTLRQIRYSGDLQSAAA